MTLYWSLIAGTANVILTAEIFGIERTSHWNNDGHLTVRATLFMTPRESAGVMLPLEFQIDFQAFSRVKCHNSYFIALREIYQNVCPSVPGNLASGNITSRGFPGTSGQTFWYISLKAMKYLYNKNSLKVHTYSSITWGCDHPTAGDINVKMEDIYVCEWCRLCKWRFTCGSVCITITEDMTINIIIT